MLYVHVFESQWLIGITQEKGQLCACTLHEFVHIAMYCIAQKFDGKTFDEY